LAEARETSKTAPEAQETKNIAEVLEMSKNAAKMQDIWTSLTSKLRIRMEGDQYNLGDFVVRLGQIQGKITAKLLLDIEYVPCSDATQGKQIILEFAACVLPKPYSPFDLKPIPYEEYNLPQLFSDKHLALDYAMLLSSAHVKPASSTK